MHELALLAVPLAALAYLVAVGSGITSVLASRLPLDAQAALTPIVGAALVAAVSPLVPLGVAPRALAVGLALLGAGITVALRGRVIHLLRAGAVPLAIASCSVAVAGAPSLARGDWRVTSLYTSTDSYHWVSQARSYLHRPPAAPAAEHPDRLTFERSKRQHWAFAVPFGTLQVAWIARADPADVYSAVSALIFCLLPLGAFACARACFDWRRRWAAAAAIAVAIDATLLFASHFAWQQQVAGTAFAFAAVAVLRLGLEPGRPRRELVLAALLAAAALASYRLGFAPYFVGIFAAVVGAYGWSHRADARRAWRRAGAFGGAFALLGAPSIAAVLAGFGGFLASGGFSTVFKETFPHGQIADALGLVPRLWAREAGWPEPLALGWLAVASVVAAVALVAGVRTARGGRIPRADFLAAGAALSLGGYAVFLLPPFSPYLSYKILAYGAPFLVLLALSPFAAGLGRAAVPAALVLGALVVPSAAVGTARAIADSRTPGSTTALAASPLPHDGVVSLALDDPWEQAWAAYYLREHRLSVERPSFLFTGEGWHHDSSTYRHRPVAYVVARRPAGEVLWRRGELTISACSARSAKPSERATAGSAACSAGLPSGSAVAAGRQGATDRAGR